MSNLKKYEDQKPTLVKAKENFPKISDAKMSEIKTTINYIITLLGVSKDIIKEELLVYIDYLKRSQGGFTTEELKQAFIKAINGDFAGIKIYNKLDATQTGRVMKAYQDYYRNNHEIKNYIRKSKEILEIGITEEQKTSNAKKYCQEMYEWFLKDKVEEKDLHSFYHFIFNFQSLTLSEITRSQIIADSEKWRRAQAIKIKADHRKRTFNDVLAGIDTDAWKKGRAVLEAFKRAKVEKINNIITEEIIQTEI